MTRGKRHFNIVIAIDGSPAAKAAVTTTVQFPWPDGTHAFAVVAKQVRADYRRSILLAALDRTAEFIAKKRGDLVVVGAKGVSGVRHLLLGSVAEGALNRSRVPVFIAR